MPIRKKRPARPAPPQMAQPWVREVSFIFSSWRFWVVFRDELEMSR
jgi:hypothetical protein